MDASAACHSTPPRGNKPSSALPALPWPAPTGSSFVQSCPQLLLNGSLKIPGSHTPPRPSSSLPDPNAADTSQLIFQDTDAGRASSTMCCCFCPFQSRVKSPWVALISTVTPWSAAPTAFWPEESRLFFLFCFCFLSLFCLQLLWEVERKAKLDSEDLSSLHND